MSTLPKLLRIAFTCLLCLAPLLARAGEASGNGSPMGWSMGLSLLGALAVLVVAVSIVLHDQRDARTLRHYERTYLRKQGWAQAFGSYEVRSFDAGMNWWAVQSGPQREVKVLGAAEAVHPGLLAHLGAMDRLFAQGDQGPLDLGSQADVDLLTQAGFTVAHKGA